MIVRAKLKCNYLVADVLRRLKKPLSRALAFRGAKEGAEEGGFCGQNREPRAKAHEIWSFFVGLKPHASTGKTIQGLPQQLLKPHA
jgi:hypothetical protein